MLLAPKSSRGTSIRVYFASYWNKTYKGNCEQHFVSGHSIVHASTFAGVEVGKIGWDLQFQIEWMKKLFIAHGEY